MTLPWFQYLFISLLKPVKRSVMYGIQVNGLPSSRKAVAEVLK